MPAWIHCPTCPGGRAYPFRRVDKAEEEHIASVLGTKDAPGFFRCTGDTSTGQCRWVQPRWNQSKGFSLPEEFG
ncbi:hypothetical protein [Streptomyces sp. NPDC054829]|nr:hypothetical protein SBE_001585 [Streptomyces sp. SBE_14.2]